MNDSTTIAIFGEGASGVYLVPDLRWMEGLDHYHTDPVIVIAAGHCWLAAEAKERGLELPVDVGDVIVIA